MQDLISRQAAINRATKEHDFYRGADTVSDKARRDELLNVMCWLGELPSAQPEPSYEAIKEYCRKRCLSIVDTALLEKYFPSAQPEQHGRVFKGIVVEYPTYSTYPEYEGKPYFSIKYMENGQGFIGYGTFKPEVLSEYLKEYFIPSAQPEQRWIPVSEGLPKEYGEYICTMENGQVQECGFVPENQRGLVDGWSTCEADGHKFLGYADVLAWMPLPEPWKEGESDG